MNNKNSLMNKKGFVYTTVVSIFLLIFLSIFYTFEFYKVASKDDTIESRVRTMNDFLKDLEVDTERAIYISGFRSFIAIEEHISESGEFIQNINSTFLELFFNGTIGNSSPQIMNESTFSLYLQKINSKSQNFDISMNMSIIKVNLLQENPWNIKINLEANLNIIDNKGLAFWNFNETFSAQIPIENFKDSLYSVNTQGRFPNFIKMTNITEFIVNNVTDNLLSHIDNSYYKASSKAPSFLMRFEGNLSSDPNGIESLIDISFLEDQEDIIVYYDRSVVDYIYFGNQTTNNSCNVQNMPAWFKIDEEHINDYEINELNYTSC